MIRRRVAAKGICVVLILCGQLRSSERARSSSASRCMERSSENRIKTSAESWQLAHSRNFTACCPPNIDPQTVLAVCEAARKELHRYWFDTDAVDRAWTPRCYVVVHPSAATYVHAAGRGSEQTLGCSTIQQQEGRILSRRIDLRLDRSDPLVGVLPHELTHVILAGTTTEHALPRWADEGMAMLADPKDKQDGHREDYRAAEARGTAQQLRSMLSMNGYPARDRAAFCGQSLLLVEFLVARRGPSDFRRFLAAAANDGFDKALWRAYGIHDVGELERLWLTHVRANHMKEPLDGTVQLAQLANVIESQAQAQPSPIQIQFQSARQ
jgi:hypothetical protein